MTCLALQLDILWDICVILTHLQPFLLPILCHIHKDRDTLTRHLDSEISPWVLISFLMKITWISKVLHELTICVVVRLSKLHTFFYHLFQTKYIKWHIAYLSFQSSVLKKKKIPHWLSSMFLFTVKSTIRLSFSKVSLH